MACSEKGFLEKFMEKYATVALSTPGRVVIIIVTAAIFAGGAYGLSQLKQDFDQDRFLPPDAMTLKYKAVDAKHFPEGTFFLGLASNPCETSIVSLPTILDFSNFFASS